MEKKPYHHLPDGTFRNPEGSPVRTSQAKFSYTQFIKLKKKIDMTVPKEHVVAKEKVLSDLEKYKNIFQELDVTLIYSVETHTHADHISGSGELNEIYGSKILSSLDKMDSRKPRICEKK